MSNPRFFDIIFSVPMQLLRELKRVLISLLFLIEQADPKFKPDVVELFDEFSDMVYKIAFVRVSQPSDADDVFQDVFMQLVRHANKLRSREHAKAWLIRCTMNFCNSHHRSAWQKKTVGIEESFYSGQTELGYEHIELLEAVRSLTPEHQEVIHLFYYEGYSGKEIADILDINENTVKSRLRRARQELQSVWGEEENPYAAE